MSAPYAIEIAPAAPARNWLDHFSIERGIESVATHVAGLASSRTPEQTTKAVYMGGLKYFIGWLDGRMPTLDIMTHFVAHLTQRGLVAKTINARYLAVARLYLKALAKQHRPGLTGTTREFVADCALEIREASEIESAKKDVTSYVAPLWNPKFHRLSIDQVNAVLDSLPRTTLAGLRDYALLRVGFSTGLRLAELARISLSSIREVGEDLYLLSVRGKRNNFDPVVLDADAYKSILRYIMAYNRALPVNDPRRIVNDVPLWQPLTKYDTPWPVGTFDPCKGLSHQGLRNVIGNRTQATLGKSWRLTPHDLRRTFAAAAWDAGMPLPDIQAAMRHGDISITMKYIGERPDYKSRMLANRVTFAR